MKNSTHSINTYIMRTITLFCLFCSSLFLSAQNDSYELYTYGTKIKFIPNSCDNLPAEADGKITFCDAKGNLGIVEKSYGLAGDIVLKKVENYYNQDQIFLTTEAISILKEDGTWFNIPFIAIESNVGYSNVEDAILNSDGKLLLGDPQGNRNFGVPYFDLVTSEFGVYNLPTTQILYSPRLFGYDVASQTTYFVLTIAGFGETILMTLKDEELLTVGSLNATGSAGSSPDFLKVQGNFLYVGNSSRVFSVQLDEFLIKRIEGGFTEDVTGIAIAPDGTFWFSNDDNTENGLYAYNTESEEVVKYEYIVNGDDYEFKDVTVDANGEIWCLGENAQNSTIGAVLKLKVESGNPIWTTYDTSYFESLSLPISVRLDRLEHAVFSDGKVHVSFESRRASNVVSWNSSVEAMYFEDDVWKPIEEEVPGNFYSRLFNRSNGQTISAETFGTATWFHFPDSFNDLIKIEDDQILGPIEFEGRDDDRLSLDNFGRPVIATTDKIQVLNFPITYSYPTAGGSQGVRESLTYNDQVWGLNRFDDIVEVFLDGVKLTDYNLDNLESGSSFGADSDGNVVYGRYVVGEDLLSLNRYNPINQTTATFSFTPPEKPEIEGNSTISPRLFPLSFQKMAYVFKESIILQNDLDFSMITATDLNLNIGSGFSIQEHIEDVVTDANDNLYLLTTFGRIIILENIFSDVAISEFTFQSGNDNVLPLVDLNFAKALALDANGGLWTQGFDGFLKINLTNSPPQTTVGKTKRILGSVYYDANNNEQFDEGEAAANQRISLLKDGESVPRYAYTNDEGQFFFSYAGTGNYKVVSVGGDFYLTTEDDTVRDINVADLSQDTVVAPFRLVSNNVEGILIKTATKEGVWGFDNRLGFDNTFTVAIGSLANLRTYNNLDFTFLLQNSDEESSNIIPDIKNIKVTRVSTTGSNPIIYDVTIDPRANGWMVLEDESNFTETVLNLQPDVTQLSNSLELKFTIDLLAPFEMIIIEVETERFDPTQSGQIIEFGISEFASDNLSAEGTFERFNIIPRIEAEGLNEPEDLGRFVNPITGTNIGSSGGGRLYGPRSKRARIFSSYDPNDKLVSPGLPKTLNEVDLDTDFLRYTIRFENEGNFSAKDIYILDDIDPNIDINSIQLIEASHDVQLSIEEFDGTRTLKFAFNDIFLDFSANDPIASQGYVKYSVRPIEDIAVNTIVENTAAIYFDQNPPIITNTTQNKFVDLQLSADDFSQNLNAIKVFPNPVLDIIQIELPNQATYNVRVFDLTGRQLSQQSFDLQSKISLSLGHLSTGYYVLKIDAQNASASVKILKQ